MAYNKDKREDNRKFDGINILPGSNEYKERLLDKKGIDEKTQEDVYDAMRGKKRSKHYNKTKNDIKSVEEIKSEKDLDNNKIDDKEDEEILDKKKKENEANFFDSATKEYLINKRLKKRVAEDKAYKKAYKKALETETTKDDEYVNKKYKKDLKDITLDHSKDVDDFELDF